jgi:hypothetical protein
MTLKSFAAQGCDLCIIADWNTMGLMLIYFAFTLFKAA